MNDTLAPSARHELAAWLRANRRRFKLAIFDTSTSDHVFRSNLAVEPFKMTSGPYSSTPFLFAPIAAE